MRIASSGRPHSAERQGNIDTVHHAETELARVLGSVAVGGRENTGAGFYTDLVPDRERYLPIGFQSPLGDAFAYIDGLEHGIGFLVFLTDGYPTLLEGYSLVGEDTSKIDFGTANFTIGWAP